MPHTPEIMHSPHLLFLYTAVTLISIMGQPTKEEGFKPSQFLNLGKTLYGMCCIIGTLHIMGQIVHVSASAIFCTQMEDRGQP